MRAGNVSDPADARHAVGSDLGERVPIRVDDLRNSLMP